MKPTIQPVSLRIIVSDFKELQRQNVTYKMGAKAAIGTPISKIHRLDCSGYFRWAMAHASGGDTVPPDGSQNQLAWADANLVEVPYLNAVRYMTRRRLFAAFMKPFENGCGDVGHVWFLNGLDTSESGAVASTMESHFGKGIDSRSYAYPALFNHVYKCFEIPTLETQGI